MKGTNYMTKSTYKTNNLKSTKEWAPGFYSEKLPKIQCQLKKPVYYLMEEQGETYFKHA
jgi:hypothetical protein